MDGAYPIIAYKQTGYTYEKVIDHVIKPIDLDVTKLNLESMPDSD